MSDSGAAGRDAIREAVGSWLAATFLKGSRAGVVHAETRLLGGDLLDSIGMLELTVHLEDSFGIAIAADEIVPAHFGTLGALAAFVESKRRSAT